MTAAMPETKMLLHWVILAEHGKCCLTRILLNAITIVALEVPGKLCALT